jgi:hypothetical protein
MKSLQRLFAGLLIIALVSGVSARTQEQDVDITGIYNERDGEFFQVVKNGATYQVLWRYKAGDWVGVAIREGSTFAIAWQRSDRANLGVSLYRIEKGDRGPRMAGGWTNYPGGGIVADTLNFSRRAGTQAAFNIGH